MASAVLGDWMRMEAPVEWLLEGEPFVRYRTMVDLMGEPENARAVVSARGSMLEDFRVVTLADELSRWPRVVIASHKSAGQPFHKLTFLADLGLTVSDDGVDAIVSAILQHTSDEGPFQLTVNISEAHGGSGAETWGWALCDAPLVVSALAKMGMAEEPAVRAAADYLVALVRGNGWPCVVSKEMGGWRGPGRKDDPCPFATLAMLKMLSQFEDLRDSEASHAGAEALLGLWADSRERHPYMFFMGTDFRKIKAPFVWYDLLHVLEVLTRFPWLTHDPRLIDMANTLSEKTDDEGRFTPESVWTAWKGWEFAQKREPSRWVTLLVWRILDRMTPSLGT